MAYVSRFGRVVGVCDAACEGGSGEHAGEDIHHDREGGAFGAAHGEHYAFEGGGGVGGGMAGGVECPVRGDLLASTQGFVDFPPRCNTWCHVEDEGLACLDYEHFFLLSDLRDWGLPPPAPGAPHAMGDTPRSLDLPP